MPAKLLVILFLLFIVIAPHSLAAALVGTKSSTEESYSNLESSVEYFDDQESEFIADFELADTLDADLKKYKDPEFLAAEYKRGRMAFLFGQYETAFKIIEPLASHGYAKAQATIGWMYHTGKGKKKDMSEAFNWYQKAAKQNHAVAQNNIGVFYEQGSGVGKSEKNAAKWYREAAEWGYPYAQYNLGVLYQEGRGVKKNDKEAQFWLQIAALQGVEQAIVALEKMSGKVHKGKTIKSTKSGVDKGPQWARHGKKSDPGKTSPHTNPHGSSGYNALVDRIKSNLSSKDSSDFGDSLGSLPTSSNKSTDKAKDDNVKTRLSKSTKVESHKKENAQSKKSQSPVSAAGSKSGSKNNKDWKAGPQFDKWLSDAQVAQQRLKAQKLEKKTNSHSLKIFNDDWVSEQNPKHYTVQLARSDELEWLLKMARKQPMLKETAYYTSMIDGKKWYYLIYGNFKTLKTANDEISNLPKAVKQWSPWVRRFSEVHSNMDMKAISKSDKQN